MRFIARRAALAGVTGIAVASLSVAATSPALAAGSSSGGAASGVTSAARTAVPSAPVTGSWRDPATGATGTLRGTFTPKSFAVQQGKLVATGQLAATVTDSAGKTVRTVTQQVTLPVSATTSSTAGQQARPAAGTPADRALAAAPPAQCNVLNLVLGPLNLNLLGLVVTLNQVNLNIIAVPGAGALLGNLLCAVAGLLDGAGALAQISALLNQILGILNGLGPVAAAQ